MMKLNKIVLLIVLTNIFFSCEDVIEVETPTTEPRLSIDAMVRVDTNISTTKITVNAGVTSSFFTEIEPASLDQIILINSTYESTAAQDENSITLVEVTPGVYEAEKSTSFFTEGELQLSIVHEGESYLALTSFAKSSSIDNLVQGDNSLFSETAKEIEISFTDDGTADNYYLFDFGAGEYLVTEDEFYQGQTFIFSTFVEDAEDNEVEIALLGVNEEFFNYMNQLIVQAGGSQGPFQTPSGTVRGNIINVTSTDDSVTVDNTDNFALGYFAVCETFKKSIVLE